ncbi:hypothetical protein BH23GEM1_BH23GEM1_11580 [soil metagenome]
MPAPEEQLRVLVLNASLEHAAELSNTGELADLVIDNMREHRIVAETVRLADQNLPVGLGFRESPDDDWPAIVERIKNADVVIFATPIMNFTLPPECCTYWVGEVGLDPQTDRKRRLVNKSTRHMAANMARNLVFYAQLLRKFPLTPAVEPRDV